MLTSSARETLRGVETVIVDEIHSVAATKRGAHLMLSLERLEAIAERPPQRIGLSATQRPLEEIARFLGGFDEPGRPGPVTIVDAGVRKQLDLEVIVPVEDMARSARPSPSRTPWARRARRVDRLVDLAVDPPRAARADPRAPLDDRVRQRPARAPNASPPELNELAGGGSGARPPRLARARAADRGRGRAQGGPAPRDRRHVVASSSGSTWARSTSWSRWRPRLRSRAGCSGSAAPGHQVGAPSVGKLFPKFRGDLLQMAVVAERHARCRHRGDALPAEPARRAGAAARRDDRGRRVARRRSPRGGAARRQLRRALRRRVRRGARHAGRPLPERRVRRAPAPGRLGPDERRRPRARGRRRDSRSPPAARSRTAGCSACSRPTARASASSTRSACTSRAAARSSCWAPARWRIEEITRDRVIVTPAPGEHGKLPFWKAPGPGRPVELGRAIGAFTRELRSTRPPTRPLASLQRRPRARRAGPRTTWSTTLTNRPKPPAPSPTTARSWSSGSATSSATGGSASSRRSARGCTRRGRSRSRRG